MGIFVPIFQVRLDGISTIICNIRSYASWTEGRFSYANFWRAYSARNHVLLDSCQKYLEGLTSLTPPRNLSANHKEFEFSKKVTS
jgi:hypothetical protein